MLFALHSAESYVDSDSGEVLIFMGTLFMSCQTTPGTSSRRVNKIHSTKKPLA